MLRLRACTWLWALPHCSVWHFPGTLMYWELTYTLSKNLYSRSASWGWKIDFIWGLLCVLIDRVLALLFLIFWNLHAVCLLFPSLLWIFTYSFVQAFSCSFNKHELGALRAGGLPAGANGKEPVCQGRAVRDLGWSLSREDPLEEGMVTHPSLLAWRIPRTEKPVGLQSMGSQRVWHYWATKHPKTNRIKNPYEDWWRK